MQRWFGLSPAGKTPQRSKIAAAEWPRSVNA
jgi:hypothetical protein